MSKGCRRRDWERQKAAFRGTRRLAIHEHAHGRWGLVSADRGGGGMGGRRTAVVGGEDEKR